jgi:hypothetical protein
MIYSQGYFSFIQESNIKYSKEIILEKLKKLTPLKYNRFYWWRLYTDNVTYLSKKSPLKQRIINGDFDPSSYLWQAQLALYNAKEKTNLLTDDHEKQIEKLNLDLVRYKKLVEEFEKEETFRLNAFYDAFCKEFFLTKEGLEEEILNFKGTILELYDYLKIKFG